MSAQSAPTADPNLASHFEDMDQQNQSHLLGMWFFLVQEVMFFGAVFAAYTVCRMMYPEAWAEGSHHLDVTLGAFNTAVLLGSSFTMVLAVWAAQTGRRKGIVAAMLGTMALGLVFLGVKVVEYTDKWHHHLVPGKYFHTTSEVADPANIELFFSFYFIMTGLHAVHMIIGMVLMVIYIVRAYRGWYTPTSHTTIENFGLYWHFVDIVWIFLFPFLYLVGRH